MDRYTYKGKEYIYIEILQDKTNNKEMVLYRDSEDKKLYVREVGDFEHNFIKCKGFKNMKRQQI